VSFSARDAERSLVERLSRPGGVVDRAREMATQVGARPFRVFLTWTVFSGASRGQGEERVLHRHEIQPRPRVDTSSITRNPMLVGVYPEGSVRVDEVTTALTQDELLGRVLPGGGALPVDQGRVAFFVEVVEDGRGDQPAPRGRFRFANMPSRESENMQWVLILAPVSDPMKRDGQPERPGRT
jgi:hypothetical protein